MDIEQRHHRCFWFPGSLAITMLFFLPPGDKHIITAIKKLNVRMHQGCYMQANVIAHSEYALAYKTAYHIP